MISMEAAEEYGLAVKQGQKESKELTAAGLCPYPAVLDELLGTSACDTAIEVGLIEIPAERIVGTKSAGRTNSFSASFLPLLPQDTEFAAKWKHLCAAHLGDEGIRDPILCYEYLGNFYVQEGNKRVSVLRHFGAPRIPGIVKRILPARSEDPQIRAYFEFLDYYKSSRLYSPQFRRPGDYGKFLKAMGKAPGQDWSDEERKTFNAGFHYFRTAFTGMKTKIQDVLPEEALLLWLQLYPFDDLIRLSATELQKTLDALTFDVATNAAPEETVQVETKAKESPKAGILTRMISPDHLHVAFVHQLTAETSPWVAGHEAGRAHLEAALGDKVHCRSYFEANTPEAADEKIRQAVEDGADLVFTTAPMLSRATLKAAVQDPRVSFYNCSVDQPYSSIRTYYGRMYEAKFISGAIAGAMAKNDRIGYIAPYPILGVPASINAFALGAQFTNPQAKIELSWSCCKSTSQADFYEDGIRVISNREVPAYSHMYWDIGHNGTYLMADCGKLTPLGAPVWVWGKFYENAVNYYLSGGKKGNKDPYSAVNYWLGMDSGVIDIELSDKLPDGVRAMAELLRESLISGRLDPFARRIVDQNGIVRNDGTQMLTPKERLHMDWLCSNVAGEIPAFESILPMSRAMVRELGLYRDTLPAEDEVPAP